MKTRKRCGNCRWYVPGRRWCRMMGVEHDEDDPGGWWHEWKDKAMRDALDKKARKP